jgi:hypothetical protein
MAPGGTAPDGANKNSRAAKSKPTHFTLDITFSGLCLLVRQTAAKKLLVLLPHVHAEGGEMPEHLMVLGTHQRFTPTGPFERKGQFREFVLKEGTLAFSNWSSNGEAKLALPKEVVDLTGVAGGRPPIPAQARLRWAVGPGKVCTECANDHGGKWRFAGRTQRMTTRLAWRLENVTARVNGELGIRVRFTAAEGGEQDFVVRPVEEPDPDPEAPIGATRWRAGLYLYHTPADELPSHDGHPQQQAEDDGDENTHFAAYYGLFDPNLDVPLPVRVPDEDEEEDEDEVREAPPESDDKLRLSPRLQEKFAKSATSAYHGFHGRLFTCTLATSTDSDTRLPPQTAANPEG